MSWHVENGLWRRPQKLLHPLGATGMVMLAAAGGAVAAPAMHATTPFALDVSDTSASTRQPTISGVAGDLWLGVVGLVDAADTIDDPSGWDSPLFNDDHDGDANFKAKVWSRLLSGSTSNPAFTITGGPNDEWVAYVLAITGAASTGYIHKFASSKSENAADVTCPSVTTTVDNCLIINFCFVRGIVNTPDSNYPTDTTGLFARDAVPMENRSTIAAAYWVKETAGSTGTKVFSNLKASNRNLAFTAAITAA